MITVGEEFPEFRMTAVGSAIESAEPFFTVTDLTNKWVVLFTWPKDFTFICPTEILAFNALHAEFFERGVTLYGMSTDSEYVHLAWRKSREDLGAVTFPWLSDITRYLSEELGILGPDGVCQRATFIIDPEGIVRHVSVNDDSIGRDPKETLRNIDALLTGQKTPASWQKGDATL